MAMYIYYVYVRMIIILFKLHQPLINKYTCFYCMQQRLAQGTELFVPRSTSAGSTDTIFMDPSITATH